MRLFACSKHNPRDNKMHVVVAGLDVSSWHYASLIEHADELYALACKTLQGEDCKEDALRLLTLIPAPPSEHSRLMRKIRITQRSTQHLLKARDQLRSQDEIYADLLYICCQEIDDFGAPMPIDVLASSPRFLDAFYFLNQNLVFRRFSFLRACRKVVDKGALSGLVVKHRKRGELFVDMSPEGRQYLVIRRQGDERDEYV